MYSGLDYALPEEMIVGKGNILHLKGWVAHPQKRVRRVSVLCDEEPDNTTRFGLPRPDIGLEIWDRHRSMTGFGSGFWSMTSIRSAARSRDSLWRLKADYEDGASEEEVLGRITLRSTRHDMLERVGQNARVTICMTTYNPKPELFEKQIDSIRKQTCADWICLIQDDGSEPALFGRIQNVIENDARFILKRNPQRLGFYHNFEQCLWRAPSHIPYVALADQDDFWRPEKLHILLETLDRSDACLVYSDMRVILETGAALSDTFWSGRHNSYTDLNTLMLANTVTGAASLFRRDLLEYILPFPQRFDASYHDWWIALVALCSGRLAYVDRPLHDYTIHDSNAVGLRKSRWSWKDYLARRQSYIYVFYEHMLPRVLMARLLLMRLSAMASEKRVILEDFAWRYDQPDFYRRPGQQTHRRDKTTWDIERMLQRGCRTHRFSNRILPLEQYVHVCLHAVKKSVGF
jgi:glycosyltransferase involved in cell wall biosynthesis